MGTTAYYGVDIGKDTAYIARYGESEVRTVENGPKAWKTWLKDVPAGALVGVESTGRHHRTLVSLAYARGLEVYVLDPRAIKRYREAVGERAKTDPCDAHLLARYVAKEHPELHLWQPMAEALQRVHEALHRRQGVVTQRTALRQSFADCSRTAAQALKRVLSALDALVDALDEDIDQALRSQPEHWQASCRLQGIPGVGRLNAAALCTVLSHLPFRDHDAFIAYLGLDPRARDSGQRQGRRRLSHRGDARMRSLLYMAAMTGRRSECWKPYYQRQLDKGLSPVEALIVLARKIARVAFAVFRSEQPFDPQRYAQACLPT